MPSRNIGIEEEVAKGEFEREKIYRHELEKN
jgi:hypothetical protein